jgi:hypothetical protein
MLTKSAIEWSVVLKEEREILAIESRQYMGSWEQSGNRIVECRDFALRISL